MTRVLRGLRDAGMRALEETLQSVNPVRHGLRAWQILALALWKGIGDDS